MRLRAVLCRQRLPAVRVTLAAAGASEVAAYMLVHQDDRKKALQAVHAEFFGA